MMVALLMGIYMYVVCASQLPMFKGCEQPFLHALALAMKPFVFKHHEIMYTENEMVDQVNQSVEYDDDTFICAPPPKSSMMMIPLFVPRPHNGASQPRPHQNGRSL